MSRHSIAWIVLVAIAALPQGGEIARAVTWHLGQRYEWKSAATKDQDSYLLAVARTEKLVNTGQAKALQNEWSKLKKEFPDIPEEDLDAFIEGEVYFCKGKFARAARSYDKFLDKEYRQSKLYEAALDRQFQIATAFLAGRKKSVLGIFKISGYAEAVRIMEKITDRAGEAPIGLQAALAVAKSYEKRRKFNEAYLKWWEISSQWQVGQVAKDALLAMARCKHAAYKGPKYDDSNLKSAKSYYGKFKLLYPRDAEDVGVDDILDQIDEQLALKQLTIGRYYDKTGHAQAANLHYDMVMQNWPDSKAAEMAKQMIGKNLSSGKTNR
jgi:tetratricopeptide (TPR) repeat protein